MFFRVAGDGGLGATVVAVTTVGMRGSGAHEAHEAHKAHEAHEALWLRVATIETIDAGRSYGRTSPLSPALRAGERGPLRAS